MQIIRASVTPRRVLAFFSPDLLKVFALIAFAVYEPHPVVIAGALGFGLVLGYLAHLRLQTTGLRGVLELDDFELRFRPIPDVSVVHRLPLSAIKPPRVATWRLQKMLVINGLDADAEIRLPDVYDLSADQLCLVITNRLVRIYDS